MDSNVAIIETLTFESVPALYSELPLVSAWDLSDMSRKVLEEVLSAELLRLVSSRLGMARRVKFGL